MCKLNNMYNIIFLFSGRGRPAVQIEADQLKLLFDKGFTATQMAHHFGCCESVIRKQLRDTNLNVSSKYTHLSDDELKEKVQLLVQDHPNAGEKVNFSL